MDASQGSYPLAGATAVDPHPDFPDLEQAVLAYWAADGTFQASIDEPPGRRERRQRVRLLRRPAVRQRPAALRPPAHRLRQGRGAALPDHARAARRAPVRLGHPRSARRGRGRAAARASSTSPRSRRWGSRRSTTPAATSVLRYTHEWQEYVTRQARWVDFDNDYKTLDLTYMESVMWAFKTLWDKGLVYEGYRVLWYCMRCETPLSATETRMDDTYRDRQDPAVTVSLRLPSPQAIHGTTVGRGRGAGLDHDAVDAAVEPGGRGQPGGRLRRGGARRRRR